MIALGSIFLFYLNILVPYLPGDDHIFQLKIPDEGIIGTNSISSLADLWESQGNFYNNYHYRVLNHTVLQVLLLLPTWVFDLMNVVVFMSFPAFLLPRIRATADYLHKYAFVLFFLWVFHFDLGRCYFLTTGSLNYSWLLIPQLLYVGILLRYLSGKDYHSPWLIGLALLNFNSNENVQIVLFVLSLYALYRTRHKSLLFSTLILLAGGLFMLFSPSIGTRLAEQGFRSGGMAAHLIEYIKRAVFFGLQYWPVVVLAVMAAWRGWQPKKEVTMVLLGGAFLSIFVMVGIPLFEPRSAVFGFFLVLMWLAYSTKAESLPMSLVIGMISLGILVSVIRLPAYQTQRAKHNLNEKLLQSTQNDIYLEPYCDQVQRSYLLCYPLSDDPAFVDNRSLAAVYNKSSVQQRKRILPTYNRADLKTVANNFLYAKQDNRMNVFVNSDQVSNNYYIIRGSRRGLNSHRIYNLLPNRWRLFFLDYLEDVTSSEQRYATIEGQRYPFLEIRDYKLYDYVLISAYDINLHDRVGEVVRLDLSDL